MQLQHKKRSGLASRTMTFCGILFYGAVLVLDEATSAMDNVTEGIVMKNVLARLEGTTVAAIVQRLNWIREFDRIYVFRNGRVAGHGTFEQLMAENGYFAELYSKNGIGLGGME